MRFRLQTAIFEKNPFDNGAGGSIGDNDELIAIDYDGLMEKVEEANRIVPEILQGNIVENFKKKKNEYFHDICISSAGAELFMNASEIKDAVKCHVQAKIDYYDIVATVGDVAISGSRCRGLERNGSDLDVVVELTECIQGMSGLIPIRLHHSGQALWKVISHRWRNTLQACVNMRRI